MCFDELYEANSEDECEKREEGLETGSHDRSSGSDREGVAELIADARAAGRRIEDGDEEACVRIADLVVRRRRSRAAAKRPFGRAGVVEVRDEQRVGTIAIDTAGAVGSGDILWVFGVHFRDLYAAALCTEHEMGERLCERKGLRVEGRSGGGGGRRCVRARCGRRSHSRTWRWARSRCPARRACTRGIPESPETRTCPPRIPRRTAECLHIEASGRKLACNVRFLTNGDKRQRQSRTSNTRLRLSRKAIQLPIQMVENFYIIRT